LESVQVKSVRYTCTCVCSWHPGVCCHREPRAVHVGGALLIFLLRLRFPNRLDDVSYRTGREYSQKGRVVKDMVKMLVQKFGHMLIKSMGCGLPISRGATPTNTREGVCCFVDGTLDLIVDHLTMWHSQPLTLGIR
ncbi:unnamed protein product, partial [Discosporangium mesarthrocarpum]